MNWPSVAILLLRNDAFDYLCEKDPETGEFRSDARKQNKNYICNNQEEAVQHLFPVTTACHFVLSAFAGIILDTLGMKLTAIAGMCLQLLAWLLLAFSSPSLNVYYPAFLILGASCDTAFLPTLLLANLFPGNSALIITVLGSAASLSFAVPQVMKIILDIHVMWTLKHVALGYTFICLLPCMVIACLFMPYKSFKGLDKFEEERQRVESRQRLTGIEFSTPEVPKDPSMMIIESDIFPTKSFGNSASKSGFVSEETRRRSSAYTSAAEERSASPFLESSEENSIMTRPATSIETEMVPKRTSECHSRRNSSLTSQQVSGISSKASKTKGIETKSSYDFRHFFRQLTSIQFIGITLYFSVVSLTIQFYEEASSNRLFTSEDVIEGLRWLTPLSCGPCVILGKFIDWFGLLPIMFVVNSTGVFCFGFVMIQTAATGYLSIINFCMYIALFTSQLFCFIEKVFDSRDFGKLVGIGTLVGGLIGLLSIPLYRVTVFSFNEDPRPVCGILLGLVTLMFPVIAYLWYLSKRNPRPFAVLQLKQTTSMTVHDDFPNVFSPDERHDGEVGVMGTKERGTLDQPS